MNKLIRRMARSATAMTLVGAALAGAAGSASAAALPVAQEGPGLGAEAHPGQDGRRTWTHAPDGYWYWHSRDGHEHYRSDGEHFDRLVGGAWVSVLPKQGQGFDSWHFDQVWYLKQGRLNG